MLELLKLDEGLKRVHKYKIIKNGCFELPDYLLIEKNNPEFYVQFEKDGLKIYSLNSKSINKNLEIIGVKIKRTINLVITGYEDKLETLKKSLLNFMVECNPDDNADICINTQESDYFFLKFKKDINVKSEPTKKWWEFWK